MFISIVHVSLTILESFEGSEESYRNYVWSEKFLLVKSLKGSIRRVYPRKGYKVT